MKRISSLLVATGLAILPVAAFAQQNVAPAQPLAPATQMNSTDAKAPAPGVKTTMPMKHGKSTHAKTNTAAPAKTAEPSKS